MDVIRKTETKTKIIELYKKSKVTAIKIIAAIKDEINYIKAYWEFVKTDTTAECKIPMSVFDALARVLLPDITAFFESEEGKKEYAEYVKATEEIKQKKSRINKNCGVLDSSQGTAKLTHLSKSQTNI